jgi:hypothetical protein
MFENSSDYVAYATYLRSQHQRLHASLGRIAQLWSLRTERSRPATLILQMIDGTEELRAELAHHFAEEECGGCLEEAVSRCPSLGPEAARLEGEHADLLRQLDHLLLQLRRLQPTEQPTGQMEGEFRRFAKQLEAHESAENRILQEGFGIGAP